jgi:hypothetical protein
MFLNIITPCSRPENLHTIAKSINIPTEKYRWIVVFDRSELPHSDLIPNNCEIYCYQNPKSCYGHQQRNFALELILDGHIYSNDDDTILHNELWENIKDLENDFITFNQSTKEGYPRLINGGVSVGSVDSHNFIFSKEISEGLQFVNDYCADGIFAEKCYENARNPIHLNKILSTYNSLR